MLTTKKIRFDMMEFMFLGGYWAVITFPKVVG